MIVAGMMVMIKNDMICKEVADNKYYNSVSKIQSNRATSKIHA